MAYKRKNHVAEELEASFGDTKVDAAIEQQERVAAVPESESSELKRDNSFVDNEYRITVIKDYDGKVDDFYLSKQDPKYTYRWLADNQQNLSRRTGNMLYQGEGWQLCERNHLLRIGIEEKFISPDGLYRRGDLVLAFIPKELAAQKQAHKERLAKEQTTQIDRLLRDGDRGGAYGAGGIHDSMKGIQTQKELGLK